MVFRDTADEIVYIEWEWIVTLKNQGRYERIKMYSGIIARSRPTNSFIIIPKPKFINQRATIKRVVSCSHLADDKRTN